MMKEYKASIQMDNKLTVVFFETDGNPIEHLWKQYGISTYIEYIEEINEEKKDSVELAEEEEEHVEQEQELDEQQEEQQEESIE